MFGTADVGATVDGDALGIAAPDTVACTGSAVGGSVADGIVDDDVVNEDDTAAAGRCIESFIEDCNDDGTTDEVPVPDNVDAVIVVDDDDSDETNDFVSKVSSRLE